MRCHKILKYSYSYSSKKVFEHRVHQDPILHFDISEAGQVYTASCDTTARIFDINNPSKSQVIAQHKDAVSQIRNIHEMSAIVTGSWDKTISYWDQRKKLDPLLTVDFPNAVKSIDVKYPLMAVASTRKDVWVFDLRKPNVILKKCETNLKENYSSVSLFPDRCGFILSSIEGRCTIHWIDVKDSKLTFSFKCHREGNKSFPVGSIDFHTGHGTFITTGADGRINFWDKDARQRLYNFQSPSHAPVPIGRLNPDCTLLAYASCNDFYKGDSGVFPCSLHVHLVKEKAKNNGVPKYREQQKINHEL